MTTLKQASRPWDKERDSVVMGDGSGILVLEKTMHMRLRLVRIRMMARLHRLVIW